MSVLVLLSFMCLPNILKVHGDTIPVACSKNFNYFPFCNTSLSIDARVDNLISLLTLDEKAMLLTARESPLNFIPRLGIPEYNWGANCIHSAQARCGSSCATIFPEPNALGATFNKTLISNISVAIGLELRALWLQGMGQPKGSNLPHLGLDCWSPTVNIGRDPRWGRMYEIPSEDPYWNGVYGKYYTIGLQNGSKSAKYYDPKYNLVIVTLKHFDAYSLENNGVGEPNRNDFNAIVSPYMFEDTYFPAFEKSIVEGGAKGVMCSYNAVNGVPSCCNNFLLNQTLRGSWNFKGYVTSDSGAIRDIYASHKYAPTESEGVIDALEAGCDINSGRSETSMGGASGSSWGTGSPYQDSIPPNVQNGSLDIKYVDQALRNTFRLRFELGLFDPIENQPYWKVNGDIINNAEHVALNIDAARQTQILLKNDNGILPFDASAINSGNKVVGVIGPFYNASADLLLEGAYTGEICHDGSTRCVPGILTEMEKYVTNIEYAIGCKDGSPCNDTSEFPQAMDVANKADYIVMLFGDNLKQGSEGHDRMNISLPGYQQNLASAICKLGKPTVLVLVNGGNLGIDELKDECPSIIEAYYPGYRGAQAINDVIFGTYNPGGKLATTMYHSNYSKESNFTEMDLTAGNGKTYKYWSGSTPIYPFGYGLSYTTFTFNQDTSCKLPTYCIDISNTGSRDGHETVFVFIYPPNANISNNEPAKKMIKKLIEFDKFYLKKGSKATYKYTLDVNKDLILYNSKGQPTLFAGDYIVEFSNGVDQSVKNTVKVNNTQVFEGKTFPKYGQN